MWGCANTNEKGQTLEKFVTEHNLVLLNDKSYTYLHPATGSFSSLDLTICSPEIFTDLSWKVNDDLHGSDHFPILVSEVGPSKQERHKRWMLHKANWEKFKILCEQSLIPMLSMNVKIQQKYLLPYLIPLRRNQFLELRLNQCTQIGHGLTMIVRRL